MNFDNGPDRIWEYQLKYQPIDPQKIQRYDKELVARNDQKSDKKEKSRFKFQTSLDNIDEFKNLEAIPSYDFKKITFEPNSVKSVHRSKSGSLGVYFAVLKNGRTIALKPPAHSMASEVVASVTAIALGVYTPKFFVLRNNNDYSYDMLECLKAVDPSKAIVARLFDQAFIIHKEYIRGCIISDLPVYFPKFSFESEEGKQLLQDMGKMLALDIFMNNSDRLPLIWNNQGNAGNVFVELLYGDYNAPVSFKLVNLDCQLRSIDKKMYPSEYETYFKRVQVFLNKVFAFEWEQRIRSDQDVVKLMGEFHHVVQILRTWMKIDIDIVPSAHILFTSFRDTLRSFHGNSECSGKILDAINLSFDYLNNLEPERIVITGLTGINREYLVEMMKLISDCIVANKVE